ncbi:hypothetical protein [Amycolatopsis sp. cmx-4-83]|uniref:hypothetical protein n=1 Tax=Amycolatopsis sp. cmx-4-83 TaxID=2790940 RepID=UPI003978A926
MTGSDAFAADRRLGAAFGPWLGGVLVTSGLSTSDFLVFAVAGLLNTAMVALVRRTALVPTVPQAA